MAQEIKRPDGIEIVITSVCVPAYVHVGGGVGWGGGCLWMCVPSEVRRRFLSFCLMHLRQDIS